MKKLQLLAVTVLLTLATSPIFAQTAEYMTVIQFKGSLHISRTNGEFEIVSVKSDVKHQIDFGPILKKVQSLEAEGWKVEKQQIDAAAYPSMTFWLKKED